MKVFVAGSMALHVGAVLVVAGLVTTGMLGAGCGKSHRSRGDSGTSDQSVMVDSDMVDSNVPDDGAVDLGGDAGRACEGGSGGRPFIPVPQDTCRTSTDCTRGEQCFGASDPFCGICPSPMIECDDDNDCANGSWCRRSPPNCCGEVDTTCVPDCGPMAACPPGEICDSTTGRCERNGCLALDLACPENHDCDPARPDADALGCARRSCESGSDCDCGFCVTGTCEAGLGFCSFPPA
jgi:hypothetical protein